MRRALFIALFAALTCVAATAQTPLAVNDAAIMAANPPALLGEYRLFQDPGARSPNARVTPYALNTALYSDGALKFRYLYLPEGAQARYDAQGVFSFPVGAVLVKSFAYAPDMRAPDAQVRFMETRLLIRREAGWIALPYVWNAEQTEARLSLIGADVPVSFTDAAGQAIAMDWVVPNVNDCRGCHARDGALVPIGPSARNLNRDAPDGAGNQLALWSSGGLLADAPSPLEAPRAPAAFDAASGALAARARAYLDVNCAHCHNPAGPAHTSGLDLRWSQNDPIRWGVWKRPVAAGRASAGFAFSIEPGHPERSILLHRMDSTDPGVMMPELGRQMVDERAVALMREWIAGMDAQGRSPD